MANNNQEKKKGILDIFTKKKNLTLLLSLLGGGATVITGTVLLTSTGGNNQSSSSGTNGSSIVSSNTSSGVFSGSEVPEWNFENPRLSADGTNIGVGYDYPYNSRFQGDFYLQSGRNLLENAPVTNTLLTEHGFSVYNFRTNELVYQYMFTPSDDFITYLFANYENGFIDYYNDLRVAYDGNQNIFVLMDFSTFSEDQNIEPLGGNYQPFLDYIANNNLASQFNRYYSFLLHFNVDTPNSYTILKGIANETNYFDPQDIMFDNDTLFLSSTFSTNSIDNPTVLNNQNFFTFITKPTTKPNFNYDGFQNRSLTYLAQLDVSNLANITTKSIAPVTFKGGSNTYFYGFRNGFEFNYFNEAGEMFYSVNGYAYITPTNTISTFFDGLEDNFLSAEDRTRIYTEAETKLTNMLDEINTLVGTTVSTNVNLNVSGFYNFDTGLISNPIINTNIWYNTSLGNNQFQEYSSQFYQQYLFTPSNDVFLIETLNSFQYTRTNNNYFGGGYGLNPNNRINTINSLYQIDLTTNTKTLIETNDNNGKFISGIYEKTGGYYIAGTFYEVDGNDIQSTDAFLIAVDEDFEEVQTLILAGSNDENGGIIMIGSSGQPIWVVSSSSTDGDFADFAASNPTNRFVTYAVSFN
jgi:hypothetical protein